MSSGKPQQAHMGWLFATFSAFGSAAYIVPYKVATDRAGSPGLVLVLLSAAALFNTLASGAAIYRGARLTRPAVLAAVVMSLFTVGGNVAITVALRSLHPAITSSLLQMQVLYVGLVGHFLLNESISWRWVSGALFALSGIVVMRLPEAGSTMTLAGVVFGNIGAFCFGMMHVITRKMIRRIDPLPVNALRLWLAVGLTALLPESRAQVWQLPASAVGFTVLAAFFGPFLGRVSLMYSARYIPAAQAVLISLATPLIALGLSVAFLGIWPHPMELFGACLVLLGVVWPLSEGLTPASH